MSGLSVRRPQSPQGYEPLIQQHATAKQTGAHEVVEFPASRGVVHKNNPQPVIQRKADSAEVARDRAFRKLAFDSYQDGISPEQRDENLAELKAAAREYPVAQIALDEALRNLATIERSPSVSRPERAIQQQQSRQNTVVQHYQQRTARSDLSL